MGRLIDIDNADTRVSTFLLLVQVAKAVLKYIDSYLYGKMRFSASKLIALQALAKAPEGLTPSKIALWTGTESHNITTLIARMKREGLVTSERDSSNKRLVNVKLTDKGRETYNDSIPVAGEIFNQVMLSLTTDDAALLEGKLKIVKDNISHELGNNNNRVEPTP